VITRHIISITLLIAFTATGCQQNKPSEAVAIKPAAQTKHIRKSNNIVNGILLESLKAGSYTYAQIKTDNGSVWAAGPVTSLKKGDQVSFNGRMLMQNFHSKSLNRDFDSIYFVDRFSVNGKNSLSTNESATLNPFKNSPSPTAALKSFSKAENGQTIAYVLQNKDKLGNKTLQIRGQVSKFTPEIMGKNWIHIRDSSSQQDITLTTRGTAAVNDIILVEGQLTLHKDFGYGYIYAVIIEDAKISTE